MYTMYDKLYLYIFVCLHMFYYARQCFNYVLLHFIMISLYLTIFGNKIQYSLHLLYSVKRAYKYKSMFIEFEILQLFVYSKLVNK